MSVFSEREKFDSFVGNMGRVAALPLDNGLGRVGRPCCPLLFHRAAFCGAFIRFPVAPDATVSGAPQKVDLGVIGLQKA